MAGKIFKAVHPFDWLIAVAAVWLLKTVDFDNLSAVNIIYLVTFAIWAVLFALRIVIVVKNDDNAKG